MAFNEAPTSVSYSLKTSGGFPCIFTMRDENEDSLLNRMAVQEQYFLSNGFTPDIKTYGKSKNPIEYVEGRTCPKCGSKLVYFEAKGKKHIKCSTAKYDWKTKTNSGCDFVEWQDDNNNVQNTQNNRELATAPQKKLIMDKFPELWREGMTKKEAIEVIKTNFSK